MTTRREKIEAMLQDEPDDVFLRYSLGLELAKEGELEPALAKLNELTQLDPPYIPAFFRSAQLLVDEERIDEARDHLRNGIDEARAQGDHHAAAEMSELLAELGSLGE